MEELAPAPEEKAKNAFLNTGSRLMAGNNALAAVDESGVATSETIFGSKPIADLFPATTIMFGDMVGFTAWSSAREPSQVFTLLETIYYSFDSIAKRRRVFKVETIGDCYVAVAGLPMPRKDHATVMARFAHDCLEKMTELCHDLESTFGPDTADLRMRIGLNSGPVTAGVLRGEKGRFQLFGDTMNMASRMESTGEKNRIQVSADTAALIKAAGKGKWLSPRTERAQVKGKGVMQTYWLRIFAESSSGASSMGTAMSEFGGDDAVAGLVGNLAPSMDPSKQQEVEEAKLNRLVNWNVDILSKVLKQIMARRKANPPKLPAKPEKTNVNNKKGPMLDEVVDVVNLPQFDSKNYRNYVDPATVQLSTEVQDQLALFVRKVARLYRNNDFHSFEHASHVTMSVTKLLSRIINPHEVRVRKGGSLGVAEDLHDHTFGITSDPLTQFACVISALIHDADHPGVSNSVLVKEKSPLAIKYNDKSVAEQNSVNLAWELLMKPEFGDLQACIYANEEEFLRFRQIVVNVVLATDIMDKELGALRKSRWDKAFAIDGSAKEDGGETHVAVNRKATIVLEHLIQASDVAHTMQHWHVYRKWNERLFCEVYKSYLDGRIDKDPSESWYKGEIGFFDFYIIPLTKKLATCGIFGVSSDEYLSYAENNRNEWEEKGEAIVQGYLETFGRAPEDAQENKTVDC
ncbi:Receptor-type guanylate cyclase gcy [Seminavis robusta]|uniref:Receptor-type guanylate cyclase gcy n=1 Tax=Seminavis robusta TaxID=568900 RepID=A0A9N8DV32_9STRA|nr:Receptor-type guanylate cyclase gcy [Seminavis robusta]|eukprot:Sro268_g103850.1 Receptor-type guanylate cyclase gcy (690) ;mRNA; r:79875-82695